MACISSSKPTHSAVQSAQVLHFNESRYPWWNITHLESAVCIFLFESILFVSKVEGPLKVKAPKIINQNGIKQKQ